MHYKSIIILNYRVDNMKFKLDKLTDMDNFISIENYIDLLL